MSTRKCAFCGTCSKCGHDVGKYPKVKHMPGCSLKNTIPACREPATKRRTVTFLGLKSRWWVCARHCAELDAGMAQKRAA